MSATPSKPLDQQVAQLEADNTALTAANATLTAQNADLKSKLAAAGVSASPMDATLPGPGIGVPTGSGVPPFYRPTPNQADADRLGVPLATLGLFTGLQKVKATPLNLSTATDDNVRFYAGYGFTPDGSRAFGSEADYSSAQVLCDRINSLDPDAPPAAAEAIVKGAGSNDLVVNLVVIMTGNVKGGLQKELAVQGCLTISDALKAMYRNGDPSGNN